MINPTGSGTCSKSDSAFVDKAFIAGTFDATASTFDTVGPRMFATFGRRLVELAGIEPGSRILDLGSGAGSTLLPAAETTGPTGHALGIDIAPGMIDRLRTVLAERGLDHATAQVRDAEQPALPDGDRDLILAAFVLFFLPDLDRALRAYRRVLRPGGRLAISSWARRDRRWESVSAAMAGFVPGGKAPQIAVSADCFASDERVTEVLTAAGFTEVRHLHETTDMVFADPAEWVAFSQTNGTLATWQAIPADRRKQAEAAVLRALAELADAAGQLVYANEVRYTFATA